LVHLVVPDVGLPVLADEDLHHLRTVLRLRSGSPVSVTDGAGSYRECVFTGRDLSPSGAVTFVRRVAPPLTVAFTPVKGDRPEWAVQKLTELGVDRIVFLSTRREVVRWHSDRAESHFRRLQKVARAAVMQSRQCWVPALSGPVSVESLFGAASALCVPGGGPPSLDRPVVLVGPEGGWDPAELSAARGAGAGLVGLGPSVLRTETAAVVAGALLCALRARVVAPA
jgi:16S rRNA (uracil1498-N3)-methyltransferase